MSELEQAQQALATTQQRATAAEEVAVALRSTHSGSDTEGAAVELQVRFATTPTGVDGRLVQS